MAADRKPLCSSVAHAAASRQWGGAHSQGRQTPTLGTALGQGSEAGDRAGPGVIVMCCRASRGPRRWCYRHLRGDAAEPGIPVRVLVCPPAPRALDCVLNPRILLIYQILNKTITFLGFRCNYAYLS
jgi:hypothetical protein